MFLFLCVDKQFNNVIVYAASVNCDILQSLKIISKSKFYS